MKQYIKNQTEIEHLIATQAHLDHTQHLAVFERAAQDLRDAMTDREHLWGRSKRYRLWCITVTIRNRLRQQQETQ
jgi:glyoxylase-like metal-dependent hydrolase (beta-lactamase superfamily II)